MILPQLLSASFPVSSLATSSTFLSFHSLCFSRVTVIYSLARVTISSSVALLQLLPASLILSVCSTFYLLLFVFFICTCPCSISSYRMLPRHLDSSATPGSCGTVAVAMCIHTATQKGSKFKMSWPRFQN